MILGAAAVATGIGLYGLVRNPSWGDHALGAVAVVGTLLITLASHEGGTSGGSADNEILYLWICLYAFYFLALPYALTGDIMALVVNPEEAAIVRMIFTNYLELGSVSALERWLVERGIGTRQRTTGGGRLTGGRPFNRGALFYLLRNRTYLGLIVHRAKVHPGMHPAIVEPGAVRGGAGPARRKTGRSVRSDATGWRARRWPAACFDADGQPMSPSFTYGRRSKFYRYYVSAPLLQGRRRREDDADHPSGSGAGARGAAHRRPAAARALGRVRPARSADPGRDPRDVGAAVAVRRGGPGPAQSPSRWRDASS